MPWSPQGIVGDILGGNEITLADIIQLNMPWEYNLAARANRYLPLDIEHTCLIGYGLGRQEIASVYIVCESIWTILKLHSLHMLNQGGGGDFIKFSAPRFSTWTQIGLNRILGFVKMRGQKDLKSMKRGSIGSKIKGNLIQNALNLLNNTLWWNIRLNLGPSITTTICDRDNPNIFAERGAQSDCVEEYNRDLSGLKILKTGSSPRNLLTMSKYGSTLPPPPQILNIVWDVVTFGSNRKVCYPNKLFSEKKWYVRMKSEPHSPSHNIHDRGLRFKLGHR